MDGDLYHECLVERVKLLLSIGLIIWIFQSYGECLTRAREYELDLTVRAVRKVRQPLQILDLKQLSILLHICLLVHVLHA